MPNFLDQTGSLWMSGTLVGEVGAPYAEQRLLEMQEISGGTPYGASTTSKGDGSRQPSMNEIAIARYQGRYSTAIAKAW